MGRRDVIEVPKAHRPPDPMVVPKRPNVWTFNTALPPDQIGARLRPTVGADLGLNSVDAIVGSVALTGAEIRRRPTRNNNLKFWMTLNWAAQGAGSLVTCRMRLPFAAIVFIGAWAFFALVSLSQIPAALAALIANPSDAPVWDLVEPFVLAAVACAAFHAARALSGRDRVFLMAHVARLLEAGPVREGREGPQGGALSPFWNDTATRRS